MNIYITGSSGFIGSKLLNQLVKENYNITRIIRSKKNIKKKVKFIYLDIYSSSYIDNVNYFLNKIRFDKNDLLIHLAWKNLNDFSCDSHINEVFYKDIFFLKKLIDHGLKRLIISGTCLEYGLRQGKLNETYKAKPIINYAIAKNLVREFLHNYSLTKDFTYQWLRIFYIKDPDKLKKNLFYQLNNSILKKKLFNMSHGNQLRDFINIFEINKIIIQCIKKPKINGIINCCSGNPVKVKKLVKDVIKAKNSKIKINPNYYKIPNYEPYNFWGSTNKLKKLFN
jgi:nucleoside-diphosphate-sugar epimerase